MDTGSQSIRQPTAYTQQQIAVWEGLPMAVQNAIGGLKQRLQNWYGDRLEHLVLYGSCARGDYNDDSDVDLLVVLTNEPESRLQAINELVYLKYDLMVQHGVVLSTKVVSARTLASSQSAVYQFIRKEGIAI